MRFEVLTAVNMSIEVICVETAYSLAGGYKLFEILGSKL
jgi:hypothetical protein